MVQNEVSFHPDHFHQPIFPHTIHTSFVHPSIHPSSLDIQLGVFPYKIRSDNYHLEDNSLVREVSRSIEMGPRGQRLVLTIHRFELEPGQRFEEFEVRE